MTFLYALINTSVQSSQDSVMTLLSTLPLVKSNHSARSALKKPKILKYSWKATFLWVGPPPQRLILGWLRGWPEAENWLTPRPSHCWSKCSAHNQEHASKYRWNEPLCNSNSWLFFHIPVTPDVSGGFQHEISRAESELHLNSLWRRPPQTWGGDLRAAASTQVRLLRGVEKNIWWL